MCGLLLPGVICAMVFVIGLGAPAAMAQFSTGSSDAAAAEPTATGEDSGPLATLLDILRDDAARAKLIEELEATVDAPADAAAEGAAEAAARGADEQISIGRRIATVTQEIGENTVATLTEVWTGLTSGSGSGVFSGLSGDEIGILINALPGLLLVIVITVAVFVVLRRMAQSYYRRLGQKAENSGVLRSVSLFMMSNVVDLLIVVLAWGLGYAVTILAVGEFGQIGIRQSMYLNAFLLVELTKVLIRAVLSPSASGLRIVQATDYAARAMYRYLSFVVSVLGYGQLLVVPIVNQSASVAAGNGVSALLSVFVLLYLIYIVLRRRREVTNWLSDAAHPGTPDATHETDVEPAADDMVDDTEAQSWSNRVLAGVAQVWHWAVLVYLSVMFIVVMTQPANVTLDALLGSAKILAAIILASLVSGWLARAVQRGVSLPDDVNQKLPLLQPRINRFVPRAFGLLRLAILLVVFMFTLDVIGAIDMRGWLESQVGLQVTTTIISLALILTVAFGLWLALTSFVDFKLNPEYGHAPTSRETTLLTLLRNAATIALIILTLMFCLSEIGLDIGPLLASAGVLGLAIGFGAQKMVQDIITGVFIQFENAINVGDVITVAGTTGTVEKLSVRSVSLRDVHGVFHMIPFSSVDMVSNFMREFSYSVCDMGVAYRESVEEVKEAMHDAFDMLLEQEGMDNDIVAPLEWFGVNSFGDSAVVVRTRIKTVPGKQWGIGRAYNGCLKIIFDERNIEIPFPQQTVWLGEAKDGTTQPLRIEKASEAATAADDADASAKPDAKTAARTRDYDSEGLDEAAQDDGGDGKA